MTDVRFLNDSTEFFLAVQFLANRVEQLLQDDSLTDNERGFLEQVVSGVRYSVDLQSLIGLAGVFALSEHSDQLSQWRGYCAPEGGCSIGFDKEQLDLLGGVHVSLRKCRYGLDEASGELEAFLTRCRQMGMLVDRAADDTVFLQQVADFAHAFTDFAAWVKDESFREEAEWRLVSRLLDTEPHFRHGTSTLIPYTVVQAAEGEQLPIRTVVVGPNRHQHLAVAAVRSLLRTNDLSHVEVVVSSIPYRVL
jgi:hypothetical protein